MEEEGKQAHPAVPSSLPEVPPRWRPSPQQQLSLASINDPEAWGLASAPAPYEQQQPGEAAGYFWLGSSLRWARRAHWLGGAGWRGHGSPSD